MWRALKLASAFVLGALIALCCVGSYRWPDLAGPFTVMAVSFGAILGSIMA